MSSDLRQRMKAHEERRSQASRQYGPLRLVYYEAFMDAQDAANREKELKQFGGSYRSLLRRIRRSRLGVLTLGGAG